MTRTEKTEFVDGLRQELAEVRHAFVLDYKGISVPKVSQLRRAVRKTGSQYRVVKNTLLKRACDGLPLGGLNGYFEGPTALAWSFEDPVSLAKALKDFIAQNPIVSFKAGLVDGQVIGAELVDQVASLPSAEQLRAKLVGVLASPLRRLVTVLSGPSRGLAAVVKQYAEKKS